LTGALAVNEKLTELVSELFDLDPSLVNDELAPEDVDQWDSLNHLRLVTAVEQEFGIKLSTGDIESITSLGVLHALIEQSSP
jgi:acyl carrier protein